MGNVKLFLVPAVLFTCAGAAALPSLYLSAGYGGTLDYMKLGDGEAVASSEWAGMGAGACIGRAVTVFAAFSFIRSKSAVEFRRFTSIGTVSAVRAGLFFKNSCGDFSLTAGAGLDICSVENDYGNLYASFFFCAVPQCSLLFLSNASLGVGIPVFVCFNQYGVRAGGGLSLTVSYGKGRTERNI